MICTWKLNETSPGGIRQDGTIPRGPPGDGLNRTPKEGLIPGGTPPNDMMPAGGGGMFDGTPPDSVVPGGTPPEGMPGPA
jgi:hypothetical protein